MVSRRVLADPRVRAALEKLATAQAELLAEVLAALEKEWPRHKEVLLPD